MLGEQFWSAGKTEARTLCLAIGGYEAHGLLAGTLILGIDAAHGAGDGYAPRLLHPPLIVIQRWSASRTTMAPLAPNLP